MAKVTGGAGYIPLRKPDNNISSSLQYWGGIQAKRGAEERARQEREQVRKNDEIKKWEKTYGLKEGDFLNQYTGFNNYDDMARDFASHAIDKYQKANRLAREAYNANNFTEQAKQEGEMMKIKNSFREFAKGQKAFGKLNEDYINMVQEGKMSGVDADDWEKIMEEAIMNNNVAARLDDNNNLVYTGLKTKSDGTREPFSVANVDLINDNFRPYQKTQIAGKGGVVENILQGLGKIKVDQRTGLTTTTSQVWDDLREDATMKNIDALLQSDEVMADLYHQMTNGESKQRTGFVQEQYDQVRNNLRDLVRAGYDEEVSERFESGRAADIRGQKSLGLQRERFNEQKKQNRIKNALALRKLNAPKSRPLSRKEIELGVRRFDINQVMQDKLGSYFKGDFEWGGEDLVAVDAKNVAGDLIITTDEGQNIRIPKTEQTLNDLFNAFEGKKTNFQDVITREPYAWKEDTVSQPTDITQILTTQYGKDGNWIGDDDDMEMSLKEIYPEADISTPFSLDEKIVVNGVEIDLEKNTREQVEGLLREALGKEEIKQGGVITNQGGTSR